MSAKKVLLLARIINVLYIALDDVLIVLMASTSTTEHRLCDFNTFPISHRKKCLISKD